jgi:hypothetical protein
MSTLAEIEAAADLLPREHLEQLLAFVLPRLKRAKVSEVELASTLTRQPGLHAGAFEVAEDFDSPLPDCFWFGSDL